EVVGDRWTLLVIRDLLGGARRFRDLQAGLPGLAPNILSERLKLMEEHGLVSRRVFSGHPPRAESTLAGNGRGAGTAAGARAAGAARHGDKGARLVHRDSGKEVRLGYFRADTGERVAPSSIRVRRGSSGSRRPRG